MTKKKTKPKSRAKTKTAPIKKVGFGSTKKLSEFQSKLAELVRDELESRLNFKSTQKDLSSVVQKTYEDIKEVGLAVKVLQMSAFS